MQEILEADGAIGPFYEDYNSTSNDFILDLIYQEDLELESNLPSN
jgi:hypothetical protein